MTQSHRSYEWLMINASHRKVHPHASGARGGNPDISWTKGGSTPKYIWPWMRMVCRSESLLHKVPLLYDNGLYKLRACSRSFKQECQECEVDELQTGVEFSFAVFPESAAFLNPCE